MSSRLGYTRHRGNTKYPVEARDAFGEDKRTPVRALTRKSQGYILAQLFHRLSLHRDCTKTTGSRNKLDLNVHDRIQDRTSESGFRT